MLLRVGLEIENGGRTLAWALDFPGCFTGGAAAAEALGRMPQAFIKYQDWIARHTRASWVEGIVNIDVRLSETFDVYQVDPETLQTANQGIEINAWFRHDWQPLSLLEVERGLQLLKWSRADLWEAVQTVPPERMDLRLPGQRWSIREVLAHVANAEEWYLDRLGLASALEEAPTSLAPHAWERLEAVRGALAVALPSLVGSRQVLGVAGEFWSPRKLLRRALWHELDHIGHIYQLLLL